MKFPKPTTAKPTAADTFVSQKGYAVLKAGNEEWCQWIREHLTVTPKINSEASGEAPRPFCLYKENSKKIYMPITFGFTTFGIPGTYDIPDGDVCERLAFNGALRPEQKDPVAAFLAAASDPKNGQRGGIISLPCAAGKTALSLYIATVLKRKTIVVCHKEFLLNQWRERIAQFIPTARVGLIKAKHVDVVDRDIVLASLQSLAMKEYPPGTLDGFHLFIGDEAHHLGAEVFSRAMSRVVTPVMLGLSATLDRSDGLRCVFEWHLGKVVNAVKCKRTDTDMKIRIIPYYDPHPECSREVTMWNGKRNMPRMVTNITTFGPRTRMIIDALEELLRAEPTRRTLVISHRRSHLKLIEEELRERPHLKHYTCGYYVGGMKEAELKRSESKDIMLGTFNMIAEGFDVPALNTLVLTTPIASVEQAIGRIQRQKPEDRAFTPYVIDVWDTFSMFKNQGYRRMKFYKQNGYTVIGTGHEHDEDKKEEPTQTYVFLEDSD